MTTIYTATTISDNNNQSIKQHTQCYTVLLQDGCVPRRPDQHQLTNSTQTLCCYKMDVCQEDLANINSPTAHRHCVVTRWMCAKKNRPTSTHRQHTDTVLLQDGCVPRRPGQHQFTDSTQTLCCYKMDVCQEEQTTSTHRQHTDTVLLQDGCVPRRTGQHQLTDSTQTLCCYKMDVCQEDLANINSPTAHRHCAVIRVE